MEKLHGKKIITLVGNVKHADLFIDEYKRLVNEHNIIITIEINNDYMLNGKNVWGNVNPLHRQKIDIADEIVVINDEEYIDTQTMIVIDYAVKSNKTITYINTPQNVWESI